MIFSNKRTVVGITCDECLNCLKCQMSETVSEVSAPPKRNYFISGTENVGHATGWLQGTENMGHAIGWLQR